MTHVIGIGRSATADRLDDFNGIAFSEHTPVVIAARDDFKIYFYRQTFTLQPQLFDQSIYTGFSGQSLLFAIDRYIHSR